MNRFVALSVLFSFLVVGLVILLTPNQGLYAVLCGTPLPHFADAGLKG